MSLQDAIASTYQTVGHIVRINGAAVPDVLEVAVSAGFDQINANAQLTCAQRPAWAEEGAAVEVYAVINGFQALLFTGELSGVSWSFFPGTIVFDARDLLSRTRLEWGGEDRSYTDQDDAAVIRNLLEAMGIPPSQANIESSGWQLGIVQEVILASGDAPYSLIERIDTLAGYRTFSLSSGIIYRRRIDGRAGYSPAYTYVQGQNILSIRRKRTLDGIINKADVTGLTYEGLSVSGTASAPNPYIPDPPGTITERIQDDLIETDDRANLIAVREVADKNQRPDGFELDVSINPLLQPIMTIAITAPSVEASNARVRIRNIRHSIGAAGATTTISTTGGNISGYVVGFPPVASFTVELFQEHLSTGGTAIQSLIVGIADGSSSYDPDGTVTGYSWSGTVYGGSVNPPSSSEPIYRFTATGGSVIGITLDVTDDDALHGTLTRDPLSLDAGSIKYEALYTAEGTVIAYSGDGQATWNEYTIPSGGTATALAPFAPPWGEIWGASAGRVYVSLDGLSSAAQPVGTLGTSDVTAVWVHEQDSTRVWAGLDNGKIYHGVFDSSGTVATVAWSLAGSIPGGPRVNEVRESYAVLGELWATAGTAMWHSGDGGASWAVAESGGTAWRMAAGWERNAAALLGDSAPVRYVEGSSPTFSPAITSVRGISVGWRQPELYAADDSASAILYLDEGFSGTATPAGTAPTQVNHMIRSGHEDRVVYLAGDNGGGTIGGVLKWIPKVLAPDYIRRTGNRSVRMVGYGMPVRLAVGVELIVMPTNGVGGDDRVWRYRNGIWTFTAPPVADKHWYSVEVSPFNVDHLLALGATSSHLDMAGFWLDGSYARMSTTDSTVHALWHSPDAGASWQPALLPTPTTGFSRLSPGLWREDFGGQWFLTSFDEAINHPVVWRGTADPLVATRTQYTNTANQDLHPSLASGYNGEIIAGQAQEGGTIFSILPPAGTTATEMTVAGRPATLGMMDRWPLTKRGAVMLFSGSGDLAWTADYAASAPTTVLSSAGGSLAALADGRVLLGSRVGVGMVEDVGGSPVLSVVAAAGQAVDAIHVDRQTRTAAAAFITNTNTILVYNGVAWDQVTMPAGAKPSTYAGLAVIVRS